MTEAPDGRVFDASLRLRADAENLSHLLSAEAVRQPDSGSQNQHLGLPWGER